MKISSLIPIVIATLICSLPLKAAEPVSAADRLSKLEQAVRLLQQRNAELENEVHGLKSKSSAFATPLIPGPEQKKVVAGSDSKAVFAEPTPAPVNVHPIGPEYKLSLGGYIQANYETGDVSAFEGRFGATALKDRFRLRRARITLTGDFLEKFDFKIEGDFEQSDAAITALRTANPLTTVTTSNRVQFSGTDIFINWHSIPEANLKIGQYKAPFGLEQLTPDTLIYTIERSLPTGALTPERQIGAMLWGKPLATAMPEQKDLLTYYAGVFNGNGRNFNSNDNSQFMWVGRLELQPWKGKLMGQEAGLKLGGDYLYSNDAAGTNVSPALNLRVGNDGSLSSYVLGAPGSRRAWSTDASVRLGPFDFIAEYLNEEIAPRGLPTFAGFEAHGYYLQGSYFVLPKKLQLVAKWEEFDPGQVANDGIHSITGGVNYYIHSDNIKAMANYVHTWSDFRDANPRFGQSQFDELILRMQVLF